MKRKIIKYWSLCCSTFLLQLVTWPKSFSKTDQKMHEPMICYCVEWLVHAFCYSGLHKYSSLSHLLTFYHSMATNLNTFNCHFKRRTMWDMWTRLIFFPLLHLWHIVSSIVLLCSCFLIYISCTLYESHNIMWYLCTWLQWRSHHFFIVIHLNNINLRLERHSELKHCLPFRPDVSLCLKIMQCLSRLWLYNLRFTVYSNCC